MLPPLSSQRKRSTTRTKVYLSQVAFAQIRQSMAFETASRHFWTNAFPDENGCKSVVDLPNGHFSSNYKTGKKKHVMNSFRLRKLEDSRYKVATQYKSAWNLPTSIMEHASNPWLCISHPAPAAWAFSSAYQGLARRKTKELIPEWCQQIQTDSIAVTFQPIHGIYLEKIRHAKASQQVRTVQIFL